MRAITNRLRPFTLALGAVALAVTASAQNAATQVDDATMSTATILLKMKKLYAGAHSYRDSGEVRTATIIEGGRAGNQRPFTTAFVRPMRFRFQFTDRGLGERTSSYIVWSDATEARSWWDAKPGVRHPGSLQAALDAAAGISGAASVRVPGMLMPDVVGEGTPLVAAERIENASDRGVICFRITGKTRKTPYTTTMSGRTVTVQDESVTLWIERGTFLLRKVEETKTFDSYRSESVTTYSPEINIEIPAAQLAFGAPEAP
jgi:hypothetical protein